MLLVNSIFINRPASAVWAFLIDPSNMPLWNPKVKRVSPSTFSAPRPGYTYAITYQMRERLKANEFLAEFVRFEVPTRLVIRLTNGPGPRDRKITETYELSERDNGTFLTQTVEIEHSGINIFFRFLIWMIQRFGKPVGKPYLATLRDILEQEGLPAGQEET